MLESKILQDRVTLDLIAFKYSLLEGIKRNILVGIKRNILVKEKRLSLKLWECIV
jgi:hypothetical protein